MMKITKLPNPPSHYSGLSKPTVQSSVSLRRNIASDRVLFSGADRKNPRPPVLDLVKEMVAEMFGFSDYLESNNLRPEVRLIPKPIISRSVFYDPATHKAAIQPLQPGHYLNYVVSGWTKQGESMPVGLMRLRQAAPDKKWEVAGLNYIRPHDPIYAKLARILKKYPNAQLRLLSGLGATNVEAVLLKRPFFPKQVYILGSRHSSSLEDRYPFQPGDQMSPKKFLEGVKQIGRLNEEQTVYHAVWELLFNKPEPKPEPKKEPAGFAAFWNGLTGLWNRPPINSPEPTDLEKLMGPEPAQRLLHAAISAVQGLNPEDDAQQPLIKTRLEALIQETLTEVPVNIRNLGVRFG